MLAIAGMAASESGTAAPSKRVLIVYAGGVEACSQAVAAIRQGLADAPVEVGAVELNAGSEGVLQQEVARRPQLAVAVGSESLNALLALKTEVPIISTMTLESAVGSGSRVLASVSLDVPMPALLTRVKSAFPARTRVGIIRNPARDPAASRLKEEASLEGFSALVADCGGADELLKTFLGMKGKVDFVLCLPDSTLYNSATARPLITASLQNDLPIIGFSASFVKAGAAMGVYPDFGGVGHQTAALILRCLSTPGCSGRQQPKELTVAVNLRVTRLLGLQFKGPEGAHTVIMR